MFHRVILKLAILGFAVSIAIVPETSEASIIESGVVNIDTSTGLEWLDLTQSINRSFNDVASQFGAGGDFEGWRHATFMEVSTLFSDLGFPLGYDNSTPDSFVPISPGFETAINIVGPTASSPGTPGTLFASGFFAVTQPGPNTPPFGLAELFYNQISGFPPFPDQTFELSTTRDPSTLDPNVAYALVGNWLVRTANVPEASALSFLCLGLAVLCLIMSRAKIN